MDLSAGAFTTRLDAALAGAFTLAVAAETVAAASDQVVLRTLLAVTVPLGLLWRRTHPAVSVAIVAVGTAAESLITESPDEMSVLLVVIVSAFSVVAEAPRREALLGLALLGAAISLSISVDPSDSPANILPTLALFLGLPGSLGLAFSRRGRALATLQLRHATLALQSEQAIEDERRRLARELHDVVSHAVTLIAVQAEAGALLIDRDPESARHAFSSIGAASRDALAELHALVAFLRVPEEPAGTQPHGLDRLPALVAGARSAGLSVALDVVGQPRDLASEVDLAAFRIVQEALTNALRHAQRPRVHIRVEHGQRMLTVRVHSAGQRNQSTYGGTGSGLTGLRDRVASLGGTFAAGPDDQDGFTVEAKVPVMT